MHKLTIVIISAFLLISCNGEYKLDTSPIARTDFALIQLESDLCKSSGSEYECLRHLKSRIQ